MTAHAFENSNSAEFDINCSVCNGKNRDAIHSPLVWERLFDAMRINYRYEKDKWVPTTEEMFYNQLNVLPPACYFPNGFCVGEPYDHNANDEPVYAAFRQIGDKYEARYLTARQAKSIGN